MPDESRYYRPTTYETTVTLVIHALWFVVAMSLMGLVVAYVPRDIWKSEPCKVEP